MPGSITHGAASVEEGGAMSTFVRAGAIVIGAVGITACDVFGPKDCDLRAYPAIMVAIRDSLTDVPVTEGVRVIARDGTYADTADFRVFGLAHERPGTYTVTVEKDGYQTWSRTGVRVRDGECHVQTVELTARLKH
jgi:D-serine deaminase-like pyridoxal phosphate-dependent protein